MKTFDCLWLFLFHFNFFLFEVWKTSLHFRDRWSFKFTQVTHFPKPNNFFLALIIFKHICVIFTILYIQEFLLFLLIIWSSFTHIIFNFSALKKFFLALLKRQNSLYFSRIPVIVFLLYSLLKELNICSHIYFCLLFLLSFT